MHKKPETIEEMELVKLKLHQGLVKATKEITEETGMTGISVVTNGLALWAKELEELDPKAAVRFLQALTTILDPTKNLKQKEWAEKLRKKAVTDLIKALDRVLRETHGNA